MAQPAAVIMLPAPGPIEESATMICRRRFALAKPTAASAIDCSFCPRQVGKLVLHRLQRLGEAGDVAVAEDGEDAREERHDVAVDLGLLGDQVAHQGLRHGQADRLHRFLPATRRFRPSSQSRAVLRDVATAAFLLCPAECGREFDGENRRAASASALSAAASWASAHAFAFNAVAQIFDLPLKPELAVLADRSEEAAEEAARRLGFARGVGDWRALVDDPAVDVVAITAPNALHKPIALAALAAGKAVYCEKPLAADARRRAGDGGGGATPPAGSRSPASTI